MACIRRCCRQRRVQPNVRVFNQNQFIPSAIQQNNSQSQTIEPNEKISFNETNYNTGTSFSPRLDNLGIDIVDAGVYKITFTGILTSENPITANLSISSNGEIIPQSEVSQSINQSSQIVISTVIYKVITPTVSIEIINTGSENFSVENAKLDIVRIGNF